MTEPPLSEWANRPWSLSSGAATFGCRFVLPLVFGLVGVTSIVPTSIGDLPLLSIALSVSVLLSYFADRTFKSVKVLEGDTLIVSSLFKTIRVRPTEVADVQGRRTRPPVVCIYFKSETPMGRVVRFIPPATLYLMEAFPNPAVAELRKLCGLDPYPAS